MLWMAKLGWTLGLDLLLAPVALLGWLITIFERRRYPLGEVWNNEWMDSTVPGPDGWPHQTGPMTTMTENLST